MKHEKFKILHTKEGGEIEGDLFIQEFLNSSITPRSVSINHGAITDTIIVGYVEQSSVHSFKLVHRRLHMESTSTIGEIEKALEDAAKEFDGVICQDVTVESYGLSIIFLTTI